MIAPVANQAASCAVPDCDGTVAAATYCPIHLALHNAAEFGRLLHADAEAATRAYGVTAPSADVQNWVAQCASPSRPGMHAFTAVSGVVLRQATITDAAFVLTLPRSLSALLVDIRVSALAVATTNRKSYVEVRDTKTETVWLTSSGQLNVAVQGSDIGTLVLRSSDGSVEVSGARDLSLRHETGATSTLELLGGAAAGLRLEGGAYSSLVMPAGIAELDVVDLLDVTIPRRLEIASPGPSIATRLLRCSIGDLTVSNCSTKHLQIRHSDLRDVHLPNLKDTIVLVDDCHVGGTFAMTGKPAALHVEDSLIDRHLQVDTAGGSVSLGGSTVGGSFIVSPTQPGLQLSLVDTTTQDVVELGSPHGGVRLESDGWTANARVSIALNGNDRSNLRSWKAPEPVHMSFSAADAPRAIALELDDVHVGHARLTGPGVGAIRQGAYSPQVRIEPPVSASTLILEGLDLSTVTFSKLPLASLSLGAGNRFKKRRGRFQLNDELNSAGEIDSRSQAFAYASVRQGIEKGADTTLANDFYIGEMKARAKHDGKLQRSVVRLYGLIGGWGVRPWRPFTLMAILFAGLFVLGLTTGGLDGCTDTWDKAVAFTTRTLPGLTRAGSTKVTISPWFELLTVLAKIFIAVLAGFAALGLRSKVRR